LTEPLALIPIIAASPTGDRAWAVIVAWVAHALAGDAAWAPPPSGIRGAWPREAGAIVDRYRALSRDAAADHY
jgi:hypothetical protein